jgi:hypothetical protein
MNDLSRRFHAALHTGLTIGALLILLALLSAAPAWAAGATTDTTVTCTVSPSAVT